MLAGGRQRRAGSAAALYRFLLPVIPLAALLGGAACAKKGTKAGEVRDGTALLEGRLQVLANQPPPPPECPDELAAFDELVAGFVEDHDIPGAALAVLRHDRLVCAKGYGVADKRSKTPVRPRSLFRIASLSKPITAVALLKLVERGRVDLDARVYDVLDLARYRPAKGKFDTRWREITLRQLLHHIGGFDKERSLDPMFESKRVADGLGIKSPPEPWKVIRYMVGRRLDYSPGTRYAYSNFGYCLLGRVIEKVTGTGYEQWVREHVLEPIGVNRARIGRTLAKHRYDGEVSYYDGLNLKAKAVVGKVGRKVARPYGYFYLEGMDSHGGWVASAIDLARFAAALADPARSPLLEERSFELMYSRPPGLAPGKSGFDVGSFYGMGWRVRPLRKTGRATVWHSGKLKGVGSLMVRRHDGSAWVVLFNRDRKPDGTPLTDLIDSKLQQAARSIERWPELDQFDRFD